MQEFGYTFPAIRGIQAGREYYVSMCPLHLIPKMFVFDDEQLPAKLRAQRVLNKGRLPEIVRYLVRNPKNYSFSAITASIDADVRFEQSGLEKEGGKIGTLHVPMEARFVINDGQHRRAAIEHALKEMPELREESIAVVFFVDVGLERSQQMFADLNRYTVRPTRSLSILYDHRDEWSAIAKGLMQNVSVFSGLTETERSSISNRSAKLFTLSGIYHATRALLEQYKTDSQDQKMERATDFWNEVAKHMPDWQMAKDRKVATSELRRDYIHAHALALAALGHAGAALMAQHPKNWKAKLALLKNIDWSKQNTKLWEGRAMIGGHLQKGRANITLTSNTVKKALGLELTPDEKVMEKTPERKQHAGTRR
jgi:DNA sulfur modification protein DndB